MAAPVLLVVAHPAFERARVTPALARAGAAAPGVELHDLYEAYPDFLIDVDREQARLLNHPVVALQFPFFWYSVPALLKEWIDLVFTHGFAYGRGGTQLAGKTLVCALSTGGAGEAYGPGGGNRFTIEEFLRPLEATAHLCGMRWLEPTVVHGAAVLTEATLDAAAGRWADRLARLSAEAQVEARAEALA
jgi:glutathione-regulated potassium-efflux system ancillary protein KefG